MECLWWDILNALAKWACCRAFYKSSTLRLICKLYLHGCMSHSGFKADIGTCISTLFLNIKSIPSCMTSFISLLSFSFRPFIRTFCAIVVSNNWSRLLMMVVIESTTPQSEFLTKLVLEIKTGFTSTVLNSWEVVISPFSSSRASAEGPCASSSSMISGSARLPESLLASSDRLKFSEKNGRTWFSWVGYSVFQYFTVTVGRLIETKITRRRFLFYR